jgi:tetratricopeptide (TPR) repeat protein
VAEARTLRDGGNLRGAIVVLRAQLARQPNDGEAARLLAQTLYWTKDVASARDVYERALVRHPEDTTLRLDYGRMLAETRQPAREVLAPLQRMSATRADADALLGTAAYAAGDLTAAADLFEQALQTNPGQADAARQLREIRMASAPWVKASAGFKHDDQPLDRSDTGVEAGWFPTPLVTVTMRVDPIRFRLPDAAARQFWSGEAVLAGVFPKSRLETEMAVGLLRRPGDVPATNLLGRAMLGIRLSPALSIRGRVERAPYLNTGASITTPVMVDSAAALVHLNDTHGWMGEAAFERDAYPDLNTIRTAYAWALAPIARRGRMSLQAGYAYGRGNSDQNRFVLADPNQPFPPSDPRFSFTGQYIPYYTPIDLVTHSLAVSLAVPLSVSAILHVNGAYAVRAHDEATAFFADGDQVLPVTFPRTFQPGNIRGSVDVALTIGLSLTVAGEAGRTAFYTWAATDVHLTYRFVARAARAVPGDR